MTEVSFVFYWWYLPILMVAVACVLFWLGDRQHGMLGGIGHVLIGLGLLLGAVVSTLTGLLA